MAVATITHYVDVERGEELCPDCSSGLERETPVFDYEETPAELGYRDVVCDECLCVIREATRFLP